MNSFQQNSGSGNGNMQYKQQEQTVKETQKSGLSGAGVQFHFEFENNEHYDEFMRRPRSQVYLEAMQLIDMMSSTDEEIIERLSELVDEDTIEEFKTMTPQEILEELRLSFEEEFAAAAVEFKDVPVPPFPEAVISKCYIDGCDVHAIDGHGNIIKHYRKGEKVDDSIARGRNVYYEHQNCTCVEIYSNCCRVVFPDGSVEKIENNIIS